MKVTISFVIPGQNTVCWARGFVWAMSRWAVCSFCKIKRRAARGIRIRQPKNMMPWSTDRFLANIPKLKNVGRGTFPAFWETRIDGLDQVRVFGVGCCRFAYFF
jgi:hypothetical protein